MRQALEGHMSLSYKYFAEDSDIMQTGQNISTWRSDYAKVGVGEGGGQWWWWW